LFEKVRNAHRRLVVECLEAKGPTSLSGSKNALCDRCVHPPRVRAHYARDGSTALPMR
jgi:hypothetical protein